MDDLTDLDRAMLAVEKLTFRRPGSKEAHIRDAFGWTPTEYYRRLLLLLDRPAALAVEPVIVNMLRRRARRAG